MIKEERIAAFVHLGKFMSEFTRPGAWTGYSNGVSQTDHEEFTRAIENAYAYNGWFTPSEIRRALAGIVTWLQPDNLTQWLKELPENKNPKSVAVIMAGNIPLVGFHDIMCVLLTGNKVVCRFSSSDDKLLPVILKFLVQIEPRFNDYIRVGAQKLTEFDAVIATGSNNSSRYFDYYFSKYPHIIRKNRCSVAVITGNETEQELEALGHDIFDYFGLGCRNVGKIFIPEGYDLDKIFKGIFSFKEIINHAKYGNNYDYHKALYLLNQDDLIENGFILFKQDASLHSPLGVMFYERYAHMDEVKKILEEHKEEIQCVVGKDYIPFGRSQSPAIDDYADGVNTLKFLATLNA